MNVAFNNSAIDPDLSAFFNFTFTGISNEFLVDSLPGFIGYSLDVFIENRFLKPLVSKANSAKPPDCSRVNYMKSKIYIGKKIGYRILYTMGY